MRFQERVHFHNTGPSGVCGVIVMSIQDGHEGVPGLSQLDPTWVLINCILFFFSGVKNIINKIVVAFCSSQLLIRCGYHQCMSD